MHPITGDSDRVDPGDRGSVEERLRRIEAVTDVELSRLDVDALLPELLDRVRDMLEADTAAVLLVDRSEQFLVATSARGIEEEVRQGSRVPIGYGFAGRIAAERHPIVLDEVTPASVVNPVLLFKGVRSMLGVPLLAGDRVVGVLHVGTLTPRRFSSEDVELLELVADRAARAIDAGQVRTDAVAATALQRSLVPERLPSVFGLDMAARYVPGHRFGVGGDWYDVFPLPDGRLGIAMGDVMGHGLRAAVVMGRMRSKLRAYALDDGPAAVLQRLDRAVQHFEPGHMATVVYGVFDPERGVLEISSAGHYAPAFSVPGGPATFLDIPSDLMLGVEQAPRRSSLEVALPPGSSLSLFTDGLVERRPGGLDEGLRRLTDVLSRDFGSSDKACAEVMARLIGDSSSEDDVALLILTRETA